MSKNPKQIIYKAINIVNPKEIYYTSSLWPIKDIEGVEFLYVVKNVNRISVDRPLLVKKDKFLVSKF